MIYVSLILQVDLSCSVPLESCMSVTYFSVVRFGNWDTANYWIFMHLCNFSLCYLTTCMPAQLFLCSVQYFSFYHSFAEIPSTYRSTANLRSDGKWQKPAWSDRPKKSPLSLLHRMDSNTLHHMVGTIYRSHRYLQRRWCDSGLRWSKFYISWQLCIRSCCTLYSSKLWWGLYLVVYASLYGSSLCVTLKCWMLESC